MVEGKHCCIFDFLGLVGRQEGFILFLRWINL